MSENSQDLLLLIVEGFCCLMMFQLGTRIMRSFCAQGRGQQWIAAFLWPLACWFFGYRMVLAGMKISTDWGRVLSILLILAWAGATALSTSRFRRRQALNQGLLPMNRQR